MKHCGKFCFLLDPIDVLYGTGCCCSGKQKVTYMVLIWGQLRRMATHMYLGQLIKLQFFDLVSSTLYENSSAKSVLLGV